MVFDAVRLTPADMSGDGSGSGSDGTGDGGDGGDGSTMGSDHSGCNAGGSSSLGIALALLGLVRRRRR